MERLRDGGWRNLLVLVGAALLLASLSCKKAAAPVVAGKPASSAAAGPVPTITTAGQEFGGAGWETEKLAHDKNVSVGGDKSYAHVTYKPEVKIIDEAGVLSSIRGVSSDGHGVVFNNASAEIRALKAGDIFMVKNDFAVKVLGAETNGAWTVILFDNAKLADVVQQGEIHLDAPVSFHGPAVATASPSPQRDFDWRDLFESPAYAYDGGAYQNGTGTPLDPADIIPSYSRPQPGVTTNSPSQQMSAFGKALLSGWTVENWSVAPGENSAVISAKMTKDTAGFLAVVTMNGNVSNFEFAQNLKFPVNTNDVISGVKNLSGKMTFTWEIGKNTPGVWATEDKLKLPAGVTIPLGPLLGGLPLSLDISAALLIHPGLTGGNEYSKGGFAIGWNGDGNSEGLTFDILEDESISPIAPNAMVIAFCAPRVELQLTPLGPFKSIKGIETGASVVDDAVGWLEKKLLSPEQLAALEDSPLGNFSVTNMLKSTADVYAQIVHTEGTTHAANITPAPCSKVTLKIDGVVGGEANLFGITEGMTKETTVFTKTFERWTPGSDFCKSI